jgi:GntR family transcriptional regulator, transcriptional repressor for pyruvate dehydrogenase complex
LVKALLDPLKTESLKDVFIARFEELILSGRLAIGQKLPAERELALQLGVSRPVVHEGLVDLAFKGLVAMKPRVGTVVNDFRKEGSQAMLTSLVHFQDGRIDPTLLTDTLAMRRLVEIETARLAALRRTAAQVKELTALMREERAADPAVAWRLAELDFQFHHLIAMAGGNLIYPLFLNTFKAFYLNLSTRFFGEPGVAADVFALHQRLGEAIARRQAKQAVRLMADLLDHGEARLKKTLATEGERE